MLKVFLLSATITVLTHFTRQSIHSQVIKTLAKMLLANECAFTSFFSGPYLGFSWRLVNFFQYIESILITLLQTDYTYTHTHMHVAIIHFNYYLLPMRSRTIKATHKSESIWMPKWNWYVLFYGRMDVDIKSSIKCNKNAAIIEKMKMEFVESVDSRRNHYHYPNPFIPRVEYNNST